MSIDPLVFWQKLHYQAERLGFAQLGVAPASSPMLQANRALRVWLSKGMHAEMGYMSQTAAVRQDLRLFLPQAQSVLMGSVAYYQPVHADGRSGVIARYATGRDYHRVLRKLLQSLATYLQQEWFPDSTANDYRITLDAHPVLERAWARAAGLGFVGKNSCLITAPAGSWVLIGGLVTKLSIPPPPENAAQKRFSQHTCGNCTRCLQVCPTRAIVSDGVVDARRCLAYLTIEHRGPIPVGYRRLLGNHLFGCDLCQEVCPYNRPRQSSAESPLLQTPIAGTALNILEILRIPDATAFLQRFAGSPLMRAGYTGLLRNACIVAANLRLQDTLPRLQFLAENHPDPLIREHAAWAVAEMREPG